MGSGSPRSATLKRRRLMAVQTPDLVSFRHPTIQTDNVGDWISSGAVKRIANKDGIWEPTLSDIETAPTHGKIKTISEKLAYRKFIKDLEFETSKVFERENIEERKNIKDIETRLKMTRSDHSSTLNCKKHGPKVNSEPNPSSSDSSDSLSLSDSAPKRKQRKIVVSIENMTCQTHPRVMTLLHLIHPRTVIIDVDDAKIRNIGKRIRSDYAQL